MLLLVLILVITLALVAPQLVSNLRDIGTVALEKQASVSPTKKPGESAVYRSVDVPHGLPLTTGLRIQTGYKIRDGILKDIWHQALQTDTVLEIGGARRSIRQVNGMILHLAQQMDQHNVGPRVGLNSGLDDLHALVVLFCCFFVCDRTVVVGENPDVDVLFTRKTAGSAANVVDLDDPTYFVERPETADRIAADVAVDGVFVVDPRQTACGSGKQKQRASQDPVRAADGRRADHRRGRRADRRSREQPADHRLCSERVATAACGRAAVPAACTAAQPCRIPQLSWHFQPARQTVCHQTASGVSPGLNFHVGTIQQAQKRAACPDRQGDGYPWLHGPPAQNEPV
ncbi:hypothetical protein KL918_001562 [Ogataea parapolymorpha]|nr:hypothetical protein KL918_001562 [Ogataea parapolymorpha]KAG7874000.1 hypothetical protein KL916_001774 [Ogataea parapolymorpha]